MTATNATPKTTTAVSLVKVETATVRNFFYVNTEARTSSISMAFVTATTVNGKTTFTYTNRNMETAAINAEGFKAKWKSGYFTETPEARKAWFDASGNLIRTREMVGASARKVNAPAVPKF